MRVCKYYVASLDRQLNSTMIASATACGAVRHFRHFSGTVRQHRIGQRNISQTSPEPSPSPTPTRRRPQPGANRKSFRDKQSATALSGTLRSLGRAAKQFKIIIAPSSVHFLGILETLNSSVRGKGREYRGRRMTTTRSNAHAS